MTNIDYTKITGKLELAEIEGFSHQELVEAYNFLLINESKNNSDKLKSIIETKLSNAKELNFLCHEDKLSFYAQAELIYKSCLDLGLRKESSSIITASFLEIVDNAFTHNLGKWPTPHYKKVISLVENNPKTKILSITISDLGQGFLKTLEKKFPELKTEEEAIKLAIQANTSSRPPSHTGQKMGGNGLFYLQKNIFNGLNGDLYIRSRGCLMKINSYGNASLVNSELGYNYGAMLSFSLKYE